MITMAEDIVLDFPEHCIENGVIMGFEYTEVETECQDFTMKAK